MLEHILPRVLTSRQAAFGFDLEEDDHTVTLRLKDEVVARFNALRATAIDIQEAADRRMEQEMGLFEFKGVEA